jgi:hypothetical protein
MRKKPLLATEEIERAAQYLRAKLLGRQQYAVGDEVKKHGSTVEAIRKCERSVRDRRNVVVVIRPAAHRFQLKNDR